ncbi:PHP domain-containing protein [Parasutterella muris]|uniref:PHP domain-containing protein n=2 Tax=Parasutterella TaxID=577310 RepID=A0A6L6YG38_9BURK|nr:PHP domain-containing protein [uncultured Parasutterella sp.]MVX56695.1 PHP domain-containing protein [Parasutterella muris]
MKEYKRADLHMHSIFSDGVLTPEELAKKAYDNGVELISLTDHDETAGLERMKDAASELGMDFVTGCEVSTDFAHVPIHIVGLNFDQKNEALQNLLKDIRAKRFNRALKMAEKFEELGLHGALEGAREQAANSMLLARPHFADWLVKIGKAEDRQDAFRKWVGTGKPAYVPRETTPIAAAVRAISDAGGITVLAHPGRYPLKRWAFDEMFAQFTAAGGKAFEVTTGSHKPGQAEIYAKMAEKLGFWVSTGSDFHFEGSPAQLGLQGDLPSNLDPVWRHFS